MGRRMSPVSLPPAALSVCLFLVPFFPVSLFFFFYSSDCHCPSFPVIPFGERIIPFSTLLLFLELHRIIRSLPSPLERENAHRLLSRNFDRYSHSLQGFLLCTFSSWRHCPLSLFFCKRTSSFFFLRSSGIIIQEEQQQVTCESLDEVKEGQWFSIALKMRGRESRNSTTLTAPTETYQWLKRVSGQGESYLLLASHSLSVKSPPGDFDMKGQGLMQSLSLSLFPLFLSYPIFTWRREEMILQRKGESRCHCVSSVLLFLLNVLFCEVNVLLSHWRLPTSSSSRSMDFPVASSRHRLSHPLLLYFFVSCFLSLKLSLSSRVFLLHCFLLFCLQCSLLVLLSFCSISCSLSNQNLPKFSGSFFYFLFSREERF